MEDLAILVIRYIIGSALLVTGILKALKFNQFKLLIRNYKVLSPRMSDLAVYLAVPSSIVAGILLISGIYLILGATMAFLYIVAGNIGVISVLYHKRKVSNCGCYGTFVKFPITRLKLLDSLFWLSLCIILLILLLTLKS